MHLFAAASSVPVDWWPFAVLLLSVGLLIVLITVCRLHAFLALVLAAMAAGLLARVGSLPGEPLKSHWWQAVELTTSELGLTAGKIAVVIGLASVISLCLMESGAADQVVRRFLALFGEQRAGAALLVSGYILSIPIFFDTFFMLLVPLARALALRTGRNYLLYLMAICCAGTVTHSLCAPHPGPLAMAERLQIDLGLTLMAGILVGTIPTACSWLVVQGINRRLQVPLRETGGASLADLQAVVAKPDSELPPFGWSLLPVLGPILLISLGSTFQALQGRGFAPHHFQDAGRLARRLAEGQDALSTHLRSRMSAASLQALSGRDAASSAALPQLLAAELNQLIKAGPLYTPERFAGAALRADTARRLGQPAQGENLTRLNRSLLEDAYPEELKSTGGLPPALFLWGEWLGNRNVALLVGTVLALGLLQRQRRLPLAKIAQMIGPPLETAGVIILITSAGGAFGLMLKNAGVGEAIKAAAAGREINLILLSWLVATVLRVAQGSATVAMLATAEMIQPILAAGAGLPYHPVYIFMAIGFGAMTLSWMNDSGFWVVSKLGGLTEKETLQSWTVVVTVNSAAGLLACLVLSRLLPLH